MCEADDALTILRAEADREEGTLALWVQEDPRNATVIAETTERIAKLRKAADWLERAAEGLALIADIAEGSETANSLPYVAKIARSAISS